MFTSARDVKKQSTQQQKHVINACPFSRGLFIRHAHIKTTMFAARTNQENAVYQQQQATAAKNHGVNSLAPKTPGFKTPFKVALNDENVTFGAGKTGGKGKDGLFGDGKGGKVDPSAFVTPAGMLTYRQLKAPTSTLLTTMNRSTQQSTTRQQDYQCQRQWSSHSGGATLAGAAISQANQPSHAQIESESITIRTRDSAG